MRFLLICFYKIKICFNDQNIVHDFALNGKAQKTNIVYSKYPELSKKEWKTFETYTKYNEFFLHINISF